VDDKISMFLGVPPDDGKPAFEVVSDGVSETISMFMGVPPDDNLPVFELIGDAAGQTISMKLGPPPDDGSPPPDDSSPAVEMTVDNINLKSGINLKPPPDDNKPAITIQTDAVDNEALLTLTNLTSSASSSPGIVMNSNTTDGKLSVGWFSPPPDDNVPPPDDSKPIAEFNMTSSTGTFEIHGEESALEFITHPIYMHSDGSGASMGIGTNTPSDELYVVGDITATGAITELSSLKYKTNIIGLNNSLSMVNSLRGVRYNWRTNDYPKLQFTDDSQIGLIAEEVETILPELVHADANGEKSVNYSKLSAVLIEAIKELKAENESLKNRLDRIEKGLK